MNRDELKLEIARSIGRTMGEVNHINRAGDILKLISGAGYALVPIATIKRLDQLYTTDEVAHERAPEIETCLDELRAAVEA